MKHKILLSLMLVLSYCINTNGQDGLIFKPISQTTASCEFSEGVGEVVVIPQNVIINGEKYIVTQFDGVKSIYKDHSESPNLIAKNVKSIILPETIETIGQYAFAYCWELRNIELPKSVKMIKGGTFYECYKLESIVIPQSVTEIGGFTFYDCYNLKSISLPSSVKKIGDFCFSGCKSLSKIELPSSITKIGWCAFAGCQLLESIELPAMIRVIRRSTFAGCESLSTINIPNTVVQIEDDAFSGCSKLVSVTFPDNLKSIGTGAFRGCSLKELSLPNSLDSIGAEAFSHCENLTSAIVPQNITVYHGTYCDGGVFEECKRLSTVKATNGYMPKWVENEMKGSGINIDEVRKTFSYYAYGKINGAITEWQKKKEYETSEQWKNRVTEKSRQQKVNELMEQARKDYVAMYKPTSFYGTLGTYDADYNTFPLKVSDNQTLFINVPQAEAQQFKEKWNKVKSNPVYGIVNDHVGVLSCTFTLKGKTYGLSKTYNNDNSASLALNLSPLELDLGGNQGQDKAGAKKPAAAIDHTIDQNIPANAANNKNTFAVIIGNERYTQVAQVPYANNDARIFAEYCKKTLGLPAQNVRVYENATFGTILSAIADVRKIAEAYSGNINVMFYYAGHGVPNESTKDAYLLPVDADGQQTEACYPVSRLYKELGVLGAKNVVVFMDACFSGAQRGEGMLASARGVALKAKAEAPQGNMVVFSAASGDETAYPYKEKGHGLFTYFLLKKLQESKGDCTLGELGEYIQTNVRQQSVVVNRKSQTPTVVPSANIANDWKNLKLR